MAISIFRALLHIRACCHWSSVSVISRILDVFALSTETPAS